MVMCLQVVSVNQDGHLTVKLGALSMQVGLSDVAPVTHSKASKAAAAVSKSTGHEKPKDGNDASCCLPCSSLSPSKGVLHGCLACTGTYKSYFVPGS